MAICEDRSRYAKRLTPAQAAEIRGLRDEGVTYVEIMDEFGVSHQTVANIVMGRTHREVSRDR